ncbi:DUF2165 family protein [Endozoicomonas numazuensis]|uniref:Small integral membrane protein n=1 Tax=Endozoicomonas numazuensis TaxID=1137799 RepID=A0A081NHT9_9GAMM|nr:DUF2165 domain-containing protein [Endozoicomonas numazuensis]KEQ18012.1 hypothetical protein GZ78_10465 [Endozoicomonas numazuensis]
MIVAIKLSKTLLVAAAALFSTLVVFNNLVDYQSNYLYVQHVLTMDTTGNLTQADWRAVHDPWIWKAVYSLIIAVEAAIALLCWAGGCRMAFNIRSPGFHESKSLAMVGLTLGVLLWFVAFMAISGEWFLAWQSQSWNGIQSGFRVATLFFLTLMYLGQEER